MFDGLTILGILGIKLLILKCGGDYEHTLLQNHDLHDCVQKDCGPIMVHHQQSKWFITIFINFPMKRP